MFFKHGLMPMAFNICIAFVASCSAYAQTRLIQAIPTKSFGFLPLLVAQERGFYQAEGLEVLAPVMKMPPSVAALISGEVHFAAADSAMRAALTGTPVRAVVFYYDRPTMLFLGRPEIRAVRDLQGKNIAILSYGSAVDFATRQILRAHGLADTDYTLVPMGPEPQRMLGLAKGLVHASLFNPDGAAIAGNPGGGSQDSHFLRGSAKNALLRICRERAFCVGKSRNSEKVSPRDREGHRPDAGPAAHRCSGGGEGSGLGGKGGAVCGAVHCGGDQRQRSRWIYRGRNAGMDRG
jgi:hypothetical protein